MSFLTGATHVRLTSATAVFGSAPPSLRRRPARSQNETQPGVPDRRDVRGRRAAAMRCMRARASAGACTLASLSK